MARLATLAIVAVHYSNDPTHIDSLRTYKLDDNNNFGEQEDYSRSVLVILMQTYNWTAITAPLQNGRYVTGAYVKVINVRGTDYLKTVNDGTPADNLENLQRF